MSPDESRSIFSLSDCDPWDSLSPADKVLRALRIVLGTCLLIFFLCMIMLGIYAAILCRSWGEGLQMGAIIFYCALLAYAVCRMFIWRQERRPPSSPPRRPPSDPPDDAPRPAPLLPRSPKVLKAEAELIFEKTTRPRRLKVSPKI